MTSQELTRVRALMRETESLEIGGIRDNQLARRVGAFLRRSGIATTNELLEQLRRDSSLRERFVDGLTINVTNFYRNQEQWIRLRDSILPELGSRLSMWSAGCSTGAEAYTMAMVAEDAGITARIIATDIDRGALDRARRAEYPIESIREVADEDVKRHFIVMDDRVTIRPGLEKAIEFRRHDLLTDPLPGRRFDLVVCRNVAIYFSEDAKQQLHHRLSEAVRPGGVVFIGGAERISRPAQLGLQMLRPQLYQRVAE